MTQALRRRYGRAKATGGWANGKPSHAEIWAGGKPLVITKTGRTRTVSVMGNPIVRGPNGLTFRGRVDYADGYPVEHFKTKDVADGIAHRVGHYMLGLGDMVFTYVEHR